MQPAFISLLCLVLTLPVLAAEPAWLMAMSPQESRKMITFYRQQAQAGDAHAQFKVGYAYETGDGMPADIDKASWWYRKAARQGHRNAILNLAALDKAGQTYLDSEWEYQQQLFAQAQAGDISARAQLGRMLINNVLHEPDRQQIWAWVRELATKKHRESQFILGQMFELGVSVPQNYIQAYAWYSLAAAAGDERAVVSRDALLNLMSKQQLEAGQARSLELHEKMI